MKKILTSLLITASAFLVLAVPSVSAKVLRNDNGPVTVAKTEVVNDDLFMGGQTAEIDGTVNGDVFVGGQSVKVTGTINGNLHAGAQNIDISGVVKGNVYAGAQTIVLTGSTIGGSLIVGGQTVSVDKTSVVGGSVIAGAETISIDSQVKRSVYAGTRNLTLGPDAKVAGSIFKPEAKSVQVNTNVEAFQKQAPMVLRTIQTAGSIVSFLGALIIGFIYFKLFGKHANASAELISKSFWKTLGIGFLATVVLVPALIILLITVVGIPLAGLGLLVFGLFAALSKIVAGSALGIWLTKKFNWKATTYGAFAMGLLVIYLLKLIPVVGWLTGLIVFWTGLGSLTIGLFSQSK